MEEKLRRPRPPIRTPMFDADGNLTRPWVVFFEEVHGAEWMLPSGEVTKVELAPVDLDPHTPGNQNPGYTIWENSKHQAVGVQLRITPPKDQRFARVALYVDRATGQLEPVGEYDYPSNLTVPAPFDLPPVWFDRPESDQTWKFAVASITVTGARTEPSTAPAKQGKTWISVQITKIEGVGYPTITGAPTVLGDLWEGSGLPALNISIPYQAPSSGLFTGITVYLKRPGGEYKPLFFHAHPGGADGQNGTVQWYYDRPEQDETWEVVLSPRTYWYGEALFLHPNIGNPPAAVDHNYCRFTAPAVGACSATGILNAAVGTITYGETQDGVAYWGLTSVSWTNPSDDVNFYFSRLTVQKVNAAGQPAPDHEGVERVVWEQQWRGHHINIPVDYWTLPAADAPYRRFRFRLYCVNWKHQATLQTQAWSEQPHVDVEPQPQTTSHTHPGNVTSVTLTPVNELDQAMAGQNPHYTIDAHGVETVGVQLKVTPPNNSNWLRAAVYLRRGSGELEEVAEYPYSGTLPQPYNLQPIWWPRPEANQTWRFVVASVGANGVRPAPNPNLAGTFLDVAITKVQGVGYPTITGAPTVLGDLWEGSGLPALNISIPYQAPSSGLFTGITVYLKRPGGEYKPLFFHAHPGGADGQNGTVQWYYDRPEQDETWEVVLSPRTYWYGEALFLHPNIGNPPAAVDHNYCRFTAPAVGACSATGILNAAVGTITYGQTQDGVAYWGLTSVSWTNPSNDVNFYFSRLTVQKVNAAGQPAPDHEGVERVVWEQQWRGHHINIPVDYWTLPAADAPYRRFRFRLYCVNWKRQATLQTQAWSGQPHVDVEPQAQTTSHTHPGNVTSVTLTPVNELDQAMAGQNPRYTIDAHGVETVGVQLKVTPPNNSNWLRAAVYLRRGSGELEEVAEYPYSGTLPQPYNLQPIWWPRPEANQTWRFVVASVGANGVRPAPNPNLAGTFLDVAITKVQGIGYPTINNVTVQGDLWEGKQTGAVKITINYTAPSSGQFTGVTLFIKKPGDAQFISYSFHEHPGGANGQPGTVVTYQDRPDQDQNWEIILSPRTEWHGEALFRHSDNRNYRLVSIPAIGACSATGILNAAVGTITYGETQDGVVYWGLTSVSWTNPSNDVNFYFSRLTVQKVNAAGQPAPDHEGVERVVWEQQWRGHHINIPVDYWTLPAADAPYRRFRFRLYCVNWKRQATLQTQAWSGQPHVDVEPQAQTTSHTHPGNVTSVTLTPVNELDQAMAGQNPRYTIDAHGVETVGVQLKVTPPNNSNWLRAAVYLRRGSGELEEVAEYPYSGTLPQPYNLQPIWWPRPEANQTWRFVVASVGANGVRPAPNPNLAGTFLDVAITKVQGIGYPTINNVTVQGDLWEGKQTGAVKITINYTAPSSGQFTGVTLFIKKPGDAQFISYSFHEHPGGANGQPGTVVTYQDRPDQNQNWEIILSPRTEWHGEALFRHSDNRNYRLVSIPAIGACSATGILNAAVGTITYGQTQDGLPYWGLTYIRWTNPSNDVNFYFSRLTVQRVDASGNPAPGSDGLEQVVHEQQWAGYQIDLPINYWEIPLHNSAYNRFRFRLYCVSWNRQATLQTQAWSGASYRDVQPTTQAQDLVLAAGQSITITPGGLRATFVDVKSAGYGWELRGGTFPEIRNAGAYGKVIAGDIVGQLSYYLGSNQIVDGSRNAKFASLQIGGTTRIGSSGEFIPRYFSSATRPTLADGEVALWWDSASSKLYWLTRIGSNYFRVEMTFTS